MPPPAAAFESRIIRMIQAGLKNQPAHPAIVFPRLLLKPRSAKSTLPPSDRNDPLSVYSHIQAARLMNIVPPVDAKPPEVPPAILREGRRLPANDGGRVSQFAWQALQTYATGRLREDKKKIASAAAAFDLLAGRTATSGSFLTYTPADNVELLGLHELMILHAAASYAVQAGDDKLREKVFRAAEAFQSAMQPDHSTAQPWAIFAFIWNPATHHMADHVLHAAQLHFTGSRDATHLLLLADALYCMRVSTNIADKSLAKR